MASILITGSQGFVGSYLCNEFLNAGYTVYGIDNFSKYGKIKRAHDQHKKFKLYELDVTATNFIRVVKTINPEYIIANCAIVGGIGYFHKFAYDLLATNERILANTFDAAIQVKAHNEDFKRIIVMSSSMVFENTNIYPTPESAVLITPPPISAYGFQKLATEYFAKAAWDQYGVPYTIVRPFNCVGVGEDDAIADHEEVSGNVKLMMSHVLPDLVNKCLLGQDPLHILGEGNQIRCYTNGKDLARGTRMALESDAALNNDFNISTPVATSVLELAEAVWKTINPDKPFNYVCDDPYEYDVQKRIPDVSKAHDVLGFDAETDLQSSINEVVNYVRKKLRQAGALKH